MMIKALPLCLSALSLVDAAPLLRRTRRVAFAEFGRGIDPKQEAARLLREESKFRLLNMSIDGAGSMTLPADMSMPADGMSMVLPAGMSMPADGMSMALPVEGMSMPMDAEMSFPFGETEMSFPLDETMSLPIDEAMSFEIPMDVFDDEDACDEDSHQVVAVTQSFEVDTTGDQSPEGILSDVLVAAIQNASFSLCPPSSARKLWGRKLEETVVHGVKINGISVVDGETCTDCDEDTCTDCEVATAEFDVIYTGNSDANATKLFLDELKDQLGDKVRVQADSSSTPDSSSTGTTTPVDAGTTDKTMSAPTVAMVSVLSVAGVAVALVLVQRKLAKKKQDDDKSVDGSISTAPNTTYDTSVLA